MNRNLSVFLILCLAVGAFRLFKPSVSFGKAPDGIDVVRLENGKAVREVLRPSNARYLALYHGASWCPPCQAFSPTLAEFYRQADKSKFQLLMVNYDRSDEEMIGYMRQHSMDFPSVARKDAGLWARSTGSGIPNLVIVNTVTGKVIDSSFKGGEYQGPLAPLETLKGLIRQ